MTGFASVKSVSFMAHANSADRLPRIRLALTMPLFLANVLDEMCDDLVDRHHAACAAVWRDFEVAPYFDEAARPKPALLEFEILLDEPAERVGRLCGPHRLLGRRIPSVLDGGMMLPGDIAGRIPPSWPTPCRAPCAAVQDRT